MSAKLHVLALRAAVLKVLAEKVKEADDVARTAALEALAVGDRLNPSVDGDKIASVTKTEPRVTARVTDVDKFAEWCAEHYPTEVQHTIAVREAWTAAVLKASRAAGEPCAPDGTTGIPGITVGVGDPTLTVRLTEHADQVVESLWRSGLINSDGTLRALPAGES